MTPEARGGLSDDARELLAETMADRVTWGDGTEYINVDDAARILAARTAELEAEVERLRGEVADMTAERDHLRAQVGAVEALAEGGPTPDADGMIRHHDGSQPLGGHSAGLQCERCPGWPHSGCVSAVALRAALAAPTSLAQREAEVGARVLRDMAETFRTDAAAAWGHGAAWVTNGTSVAELAAAWCLDRADSLATEEGQ